MSDIIVIGAGAAGMTAALYALRNGKSVKILEEETVGGADRQFAARRKFPHDQGNFGQRPRGQAFRTDHGARRRVRAGKGAFRGEKRQGFSVKTDYGEHEAKSVIVAAGVKHKHLRFPYEEELTGSGISYCAICDGPFYTGEEVALVGDGNTALQYGILLSGYCPKVYVYTLFDKFFGDESLVKTLLSKPNVIWKPNTALTEYIGTEKLEGFRYRENGEIKEHKIGALFVAIGQVPTTRSSKTSSRSTKRDISRRTKAAKPPAKACTPAGDCRTKKIRQLTTAAADGA